MDEDMKSAADEIQEDPDWIKNEKPLPEAKASITVRGYYKGFSVLITKRNADGEVELDNIQKAIDNMVDKGFKPSWAEETNGKHDPAQVKSELPMCPVHNKPMKERTAPNGDKFYSHAMPTDDGRWIYCSGKGFGTK